jgi:hypothetical protein
MRLLSGMTELCARGADAVSPSLAAAAFSLKEEDQPVCSEDEISSPAWLATACAPLWLAKVRDAETTADRFPAASDGGAAIVEDSVANGTLEA